MNLLGGIQLQQKKKTKKAVFTYNAKKSCSACILIARVQHQ